MYFNIPAVDELNFARQVRGPSGWSHTSAMLRALIALCDSDRDRFRCQLRAVVVVSAFNVDQIARIDGVLIAHGVDGIYYKQWKTFEKRNGAYPGLSNRGSIVPDGPPSPGVASELPRDTGSMRIEHWRSERPQWHRLRRKLPHLAPPPTRRRLR